MNSFVFLTFIYLMQACSGVSAANTVPVFMLDQSLVMSHVQVDPNPFDKVTAAAFKDIIQDSAQRSAGIIIFVEETFSTEHISTKDMQYGTPYKNLRASLLANKDKVKYFPSVIEPFQQLKLKFPPTESNVFVLSQHSKLQLQDNFQYIYIFFKDKQSEPKADVLQRHDVIIKKVVDAVRVLKPGPVLAYYTGKSNPVVVDKVEFIKSPPEEDASKTGYMVVTPKALFRLYGVTVAAPTRRAEFALVPTFSEETYTRSDLTTKIALSEFEIEWQFTFKEHDWILSKIALFEDNEEVGYHKMNVGAPYNWSYYCPEPIVLVSTRDKSTVTIKQIHVEPRRNGSIRAFSPSRHCAPFFNIAIGSSMMVTSIFTFIMWFGILSMLDILPNDRFDDPNGPPVIGESARIEV